MVLIPLYDRAGDIIDFSQVDPEDGERYSTHTWRRVNGYAYRCDSKNGARQHIFLHREILGLTSGDGLEGDHINRDRLDNRRANLRVATRAQNAQNLASRRGGKIRGVSWHAQHGKWRARVMLDGRENHVGLFDSKSDAVAAVAQWRAQNLPFAVEA